MTDLEMTRLCAEAMGNPWLEWFREVGMSDLGKIGPQNMPFFDPFHDDAQAMALVKWFGMEMSRAQTGEWFVRHFLCGSEAIINTDLNRAIVECVAKMQAAKNV